jgi:tRNA A37 threonylcarbamoyladenosine synthetase subunit TsaC/SUA5/YrdC
VIDGGPLPNTPSTIVDLTGEAPYVVREGKGTVDWLTA